MSSAKQYNLPPSVVIPKQLVTAANVTSLVTNIFFKDNVGYQVVWDGTLGGTFDVQISADYNADTRVGTWTSITLSPVPTAAGSPSNAYVDITQISAPFIRIVFNYSSGSGNLTGTIVAKGV